MSVSCYSRIRNGFDWSFNTNIIPVISLNYLKIPQVCFEIANITKNAKLLRNKLAPRWLCVTQRRFPY